MYLVTHKGVAVPMGRDSKIRTMLRTIEIAKFITLPSEKKIYILKTTDFYFY